MNGKGSKPRPFNKSKYNNNFDSINWSKIKSRKHINDDMLLMSTQHEDHVYMDSIKKNNKKKS